MKIDIKALEKAEQEYVKRNRVWTKEEHEAVMRFYGKVPINVLCEKLGRTISSINCHYRDKRHG